jgi:hypothetical protein
VSRRRGGASPFAALGLPARPGLADDEVRAAWRRIAAATHPDRADGGDPDRFAAAAAAYTMLRTASGRGEALADLAGPAPLGPPPVPAAAQGGAGGARRGAPSPGMPGQGVPGARMPNQAAPGAGPPGAGAPGPGMPGTGPPGAGAAGPGPAPPGPARPAAALMARVRGGRPARLGLRVLIVAAVTAGTAAVAGAQPATPALITGALTWLLCTARHDLAPPA